MATGSHVLSGPCLCWGGGGVQFNCLAVEMKPERLATRNLFYPTGCVLVCVEGAPNGRISELLKSPPP